MIHARTKGQAIGLAVESWFGFFATKADLYFLAATRVGVEPTLGARRAAMDAYAATKQRTPPAKDLS